MNMLEFTIYTADCVGNNGNCLYPNKMIVTDKESFIKATKMDHVLQSIKGIIAVRIISSFPTVFRLTVIMTIRTTRMNG